MIEERASEMASKTVSDISSFSQGAEHDAAKLMQDVNAARNEFGSNYWNFVQYDDTVAKAAERQGLLPMLSLGHAKNSFNNLDLDRSGDLSKDELIIAHEHAGSETEARMLTMLAKGFHDIRSAHESNKYNPFLEDENGITIDDLNAKLAEGRSHANARDRHAELDPGISTIQAPGWQSFDSLSGNANRNMEIDPAICTILPPDNVSFDELRGPSRRNVEIDPNLATIQPPHLSSARKQGGNAHRNTPQMRR